MFLLHKPPQEFHSSCTEEGAKLMNLHVIHDQNLTLTSAFNFSDLEKFCFQNVYLLSLMHSCAVLTDTDKIEPRQS